MQAYPEKKKNNKFPKDKFETRLLKIAGVRHIQKSRLAKDYLN